MRLLPFVTVAILSFTLVGIASAATTAPSRTTGSSTDHPGPVACTAACPPPIAAGAPFANYQACAQKLGALRRVTIGQIKGVDDGDTVRLVPLCDIRNHTLTYQETQYLARGNTLGLLPAIADNDTLMAELGDGGYDSNDVIGVALGPNIAVLYVSHR